MSHDDDKVISIVDASKGRIEEHDTKLFNHMMHQRGPNIAMFTNRDKQRYNEPVCINPRHILALYPGDYNKEHPFTGIQLVTGELIFVKEDIGTVVGRLNKDYAK